MVKSPVNVQLDMFWPTEVQNLVSAGDIAGAIDWCVAHQMDVPQSLCDAHGAMLTAASKTGLTYKVEPYRGRVRVITVFPSKSGATPDLTE